MNRTCQISSAVSNTERQELATFLNECMWRGPIFLAHIRQEGKVPVMGFHVYGDSAVARAAGKAQMLRPTILILAGMS